MPKLTKKYVEAIKSHATETLRIWDSELRGFGIVVLPSGRKTYCVQYRNLDRTKKHLKVGVHGTLTTEEARDFAKKLLSQVTQGGDPATSKKETSLKSSINDLIKAYLEGHATRKRSKSIAEDKRMIKSIIEPILGRKKIDAVSRRDVEQLHAKLRETPYQANRMISLLSKMFSLAVSWGWVSDNPALGIQKYQEEKRDRWMQEGELEKFWAVLDQYPNQTSAQLFKFLLLTGARKGEAMNATWDQFNMTQGVWTKPSHLTKQKKKEHLPLSGPALALLEDLKKRNGFDSSFVFPGKKPGEPLKEVKTFWKRLLKESGVENLRIHDLRHTHASHLVSSGLSLSIVGKLLGHTQAATTQRYAHLADSTLRDAAELFGRKVVKG